MGAKGFRRHTRVALNAKVTLVLRDGRRISGRFKHRSSNGRIALTVGSDVVWVNKSELRQFLTYPNGTNRSQT